MRSCNVLKIILFSLFLFILYGCGGGGGGNDTNTNSGISATSTPQIPPPGPNPNPDNVKLSEKSIQIQLPSNLSVATESLSINAGVLDRTQPNSQGKAQLNLNYQTPALISVKDSKDNILLMNVAAPNSTNRSSRLGQRASPVAGAEDIQIDTKTTAVSLIFMYPLIVTDNPVEAEKRKNLIAELKETNQLANLVASKLPSKPNILKTPDEEFQTALSSAIDATLSKIYSAGAPKVVISPDDQRSGLDVTHINKDTKGNISLEITNSYKRFVHAFLDAPTTTIGSTLLLDGGLNFDIADFLVSPEHCIGNCPTVSSIDVNAAAYPDATLKLYGPGVQDISTLTNDPQWDRIFLPTAFTAYFDYADPLITVVTGVKDIFNVRLTAKFIIETLMDFAKDSTIASSKPFARLMIRLFNDQNLRNSSLNKLKNGDYFGAINDIIWRVTWMVILNEDGILTDALIEIGVSAVWVGLNIAAYFVPYAGQAYLFYKIGVALEDIIETSIGIALSRPLEKFQINNIPPSIVLKADKTTASPNTTINFSIEALGESVVKTQWDFGTGNFERELTQNLLSTSYTFSAPGIFQVKARAIDSHSAYITKTVQININCAEGQIFAGGQCISTENCSGISTFCIDVVDPTNSISVGTNVSLPIEINNIPPSGFSGGRIKITWEPAYFVYVGKTLGTGISVVSMGGTGESITEGTYSAIISAAPVISNTYTSYKILTLTLMPKSGTSGVKSTVNIDRNSSNFTDGVPEEITLITAKNAFVRIE